ncbi:hypothetical protein [Saccharothrix yanglingensis]|uniref:Uncharacterized protein n=1 Tax=Saccharothrix yanglingensis TaxID=659496 RepID=A0ABU0X2B0_9PSEU|nr:hypothetical protein [Saccharothrix yanglingensis]MDQ2586176.1 hypothetical protein [Saccharothrix yanglingensis]
MAGTDPKLVAEIDAIEDDMVDATTDVVAPEVGLGAGGGLGTGGGGLPKPTGGPYKPGSEPLPTPQGGPYKPGSEPAAAV